MGSSGFNKVNSWVLSKVLDSDFTGTKEEVDIQRLAIWVMDSIWFNPIFTVGSFGDGFQTLFIDLDKMFIYPEVVVMDTDMRQLRLIGNKYKDILLLRDDGCRPGYTTLRVGRVRHVTSKNLKFAFMNSVVPLLNLKLLSSSIFRETIMELLEPLDDYEAISTGPSIKMVFWEKSIDTVIAFQNVTWPKDAEEWVSRTRLFGWPTKAMVNTIVKSGCYIVPIGDKCTEDTHLQWRISFVVAERYLVHSFNHTQFKVYGLLKYLLHQIKFRLKQKSGDDDIICSYFMKTVMLFAVENSPHSFWKEDNLFLCFRFCFSMLLDWVYSGYCPNYFIKTNNMFERKIHGENKLKLVNILCELHQMKWMSLYAETDFELSLGEFMQKWEERMWLEVPDLVECRKDMHLNDLFHSLRGTQVIKMMKTFLNSSTDIHELIAYVHMLHLLAELSSKTLQQVSNKYVGNKAKYKSHKKCKYWLAPSFGTNILYLASFHYLTGNYQKAIELCRIVKWSIFLECRSGEDMRKYAEVYCGQGYSTLYKMKKAHIVDLSFTKEAFGLCVPHLHMEVERRGHLRIPPKEYALFLLFLCYDILGDRRGCHETLCDLVHYKNHSKGRHNHWVAYTMIGICYQIQGDYRQAIIAYKHSLNLNPIYNPAQERIKSLEPFLQI